MTWRDTWAALLWAGNVFVCSNAGNPSGATLYRISAPETPKVIKGLGLGSSLLWKGD